MIKHKDFSMNGIKKNNLFQQLINRIVIQDIVKTRYMINQNVKFSIRT